MNKIEALNEKAAIAEDDLAMLAKERGVDCDSWKEYVMAKCGPISTIRSRDEAVAMAQTMADMYRRSIVDEFDRMEKARGER